MEATSRLVVVERALGADPTCSLAVRLGTNRALTALFADNMLRLLHRAATHRSGHRADCALSCGLDLTLRVGIMCGRA